MNEQYLHHYAEILVEYAAGLQKDQQLFIHGEVAHRELALQVAEAAYERKSGPVSFWLNDPLQQAQLIRYGCLDQIDLAHEQERSWFNEIVRTRGILISLSGSEYPRLMQELAVSYPEQHAYFSKSLNAIRAVFWAHGIHRGYCPWVVAGAVTSGWANLVFPNGEMTEAEKVEKLTGLIYKFNYAEQKNAIALLKAKDRQLHARRNMLNELEITEIHVTGGGNDFTVGFSQHAQWLGGSKQTIFGQTFTPNMPTYENFTTPDRRKTQGTFVASMPFRTKNGVLVSDLVLKFQDGRVVNFDAEQEKDAFGKWIATDEGARFLGEFALVGLDSPIAETKLFFEHTLYDENASSHVALGKGYASALKGGEKMTDKQLEEIGCNNSVIHTDIMFGSQEVTIVATKTNQGEVMLIKKGHWTAPFLNAE